MSKVNAKGKQRRRGYRKHFTRPGKGLKPYNRHIARHLSPAMCHESQPETFADGFCGFDVPPLHPIRVLSLFDGIGTGLYVLQELQIEVEAYFSSEIDPKANALLKYRHHNKIQMLGRVEEVTSNKLATLGTIHLLLGGSPCSDLSLVNPARRGLSDPSSSGVLFYEYLRTLKFLQKASDEGGHKFFWLFENTFSMEIENKEEISRCLGRQPVIRCSSEFLPMRRRRLFWGNVPGMDSNVSGLSGAPPTLQACLMPYRAANVSMLSTITTSSHSQRTGKDKKLPVSEDGVGTHLLITEQETLFGFRPHYTDGPNLSISDRRALLGKSWCVPVICDLLRPLRSIFKIKLPLP